MWLLEGETGWTGELPPQPSAARDADGLHYANVPLYRQPGYAGVLTRYRVGFDHAAGAEHRPEVRHHRHRLTSSDHESILRARRRCDYFAWTRDLDFLRQNIGRMRRRCGFVLEEFRVRQEKHVFVPWVGPRRPQRTRHRAGRQEIRRVPASASGTTTRICCRLAPTMHRRRCICTMPFVPLRRWSTASPNTPSGTSPPARLRHNAQALAQLADEMRQDFQTRFWNADTGRFVGWIDVEGRSYDYGFTFVNLEAVYYGLAAAAGASIFAWLDGRS